MLKPILIYMLLGVVVTAVAMALFRPTPGYRPSWRLLALAAVTFTVFWPCLAFLALLFLITYRRHAADDLGQEKTAARPLRGPHLRIPIEPRLPIRPR